MFTSKLMEKHHYFLISLFHDSCEWKRKKHVYLFFFFSIIWRFSVLPFHLATYCRDRNHNFLTRELVTLLKSESKMLQWDWAKGMEMRAKVNWRYSDQIWRNGFLPVSNTGIRILLQNTYVPCWDIREWYLIF